MYSWLVAFLRWLKRRKVTVILLIFTFIVSGLVVNFLQLLTLPLYWINKKLFRHLNTRIVYLHWCIIPWTLESWAEYDIRAFGSDYDVGHANKEHALVTMNHRGDLDWMIGWVIIDRLAMLGGTKAIMKDIAKYMPGIGWSFMFLEYPTLKREWARDQDRLKKSCQNLADYPVDMLLCLFAEGTRFTPEKHKLSMEYALNNNLPVLRHHLFPRTKGFCFLINNLRNTLGAVYDITICYRGNQEPSVMGVMNVESCAADVALRRFDMAKILKDNPEDKDLSNWLINLYKEKDELIDYHNTHKKFPLPEAHIPKRYRADLAVFMWVCLCSIPVFFITLYLAWAGHWAMLLVIICALVGADMLFQFIIRQTQIKVSSSAYGLKPVSGNGVDHNSPSSSSDSTTGSTTGSTTNKKTN